MTVELLQRALSEASRCADAEETGDGRKHRKRSKSWVECLGGELRRQFAADSSVRVFTKHETSNRDAFGVNELLYDVCVADTAECSSYTGKTLRYVTRALWLIESEFARDTGAAVKDFNKLVLAAADTKLFVGPLLGSDDSDRRFRDVLLPVAVRCINSASPNVLLAQVSHPDTWKSGPPPTVTLYKLAVTRWQDVQV